ncbi:hypothetical protein MMC25_003556 [Agyrium rufum]|nr:hypothetical protein [Agyrium rufum]
MVQFWDVITPQLEAWVPTLPLFFTASAPLCGAHVNLSPKGAPSSTFRILGPNLCAYLDCTGSGSETISHIYENGRVTIMFCDFGPKPRICRFFCKGRVVEWDDQQFPHWLERLGGGLGVEGVRAVIVLDVWKVQTSCGFGVPVFAQPASSQNQGSGDLEEDEEDEIPAEPPVPDGKSFADRSTMNKWARYKIDRNELHPYMKENNASSLDDLPGMKVARRDRGETIWLGDVRARARRMVQGERLGLMVGFLLGLIAMVLMRFAA